MAIDITIRAGTNRPVTFDFSANAPADFTTAGKTFELVVEWTGGRRVYAAGTGLAVTGAKTVTWSRPLADTRAFPSGKQARVELQWTEAGVQDSDAGMLTVTPGISND